MISVASDLDKYRSMGGVVDEIKEHKDDAIEAYSQDGQYVFMNLWAFEKIMARKPERHFDVGGQMSFLSYVRHSIPVTHIDIRDPGTRMAGLTYLRGDITKLPIEDNSIDSLSCLHVAEHIGLGRYGDEIDPEGFTKACRELSRVLKPGGRLYFAVPTGIPRTVFNAHRVLSNLQVREAFYDLDLFEFAAMTSRGQYFKPAPNNFLDRDTYGCGMYLFTKGNQ